MMVLERKLSILLRGIHHLLQGIKVIIFFDNVDYRVEMGLIDANFFFREGVCRSHIQQIILDQLFCRNKLLGTLSYSYRIQL